MKSINEEIVSTAYKFLGQEEIRGNMGFKDPRFQQLMEACGWQPKQAWCVYATELVWRMAYSKYNSIIEAKIDKIFTAGAVATYNNFKKDGVFIISKTPIKGALVIWQYYKDGEPHWTGHAGIVSSHNLKNFSSIEGNTNDKGGREGYIMAERVRLYNFDSKTGLVLKGFIHPIEP